MKEKILSISFKKLIVCFMSALILSAGVFAITSIPTANEARAVITDDPMYSHNTGSNPRQVTYDTASSKTSTDSSKGSGGGSVFASITERLWKAVGGLRKIAYIIAGFGLIAFTWGAIFNKISWKHFGNIMISLFILSVMTPLIEWVVYGSGSSQKLTFGNTYVPVGNHSSVDNSKECEGGKCPDEGQGEQDCKAKCNGDAKCEEACGVEEECKDSEEKVDGKCKTKCAEGQVRNGGGECESSEDLARDCYESGGTFADGKCNMGQEADPVSDPCAGLKDEKYTKCANAMPAPEKPGACSAEEPKCEGGYQSKSEVCAGKEGKEKKSCEKEVDKHNKQVNKEYKNAQKDYEKEQKEIAKDKYEARKDSIVPGQEVNCDGLSSAQCSRLQSKQDKADNKQAKKDQKEAINQKYEAAMAACHGDPDCEKQAKKDRNAAKNEYNKQAFQNAMTSTKNAVTEANQRLTNLKGTISSGVAAVHNITAGVEKATNAVHGIQNAATMIANGNASQVIQGLGSIVGNVGGLAGAAGETVGGVTSNLSSGANNAQDLFSSTEQRTENWSTRGQGGSTNAFSGAMDATSHASYDAGYTASGVANGAVDATGTAGQIVNTPAQMDMEINNLLNTVNK